MPTKNPDDIVLTLAKLGMDPDSIASVVKSPLAEIQATLVTHRRKPPNPDEELRGEARAFVRRALAEAQIIMDFGMPTQKMALIRTVLPAAMRALGAGDEGQSEDTRSELQVLFREIRNVPAAAKTIGEPIDVESTSATEAINDQDQIFGDSSV